MSKQIPVIVAFLIGIILACGVGAFVIHLENNSHQAETVELNAKIDQANERTAAVEKERDALIEAAKVDVEDQLKAMEQGTKMLETMPDVLDSAAKGLEAIDPSTLLDIMDKAQELEGSK